MRGVLRQVRVVRGSMRVVRGSMRGVRGSMRRVRRVRGGSREVRRVLYVFFRVVVRRCLLTARNFLPYSSSSRTHFWQWH